MVRRTAKLSAKAVSARPPGRHSDGGNLHLLVKPSGARSWVFRYAAGGKRHDLGLGPAGSDRAATTLAEARHLATELRQQIRSGLDPATLRQRKANAPKGKTFREVAKLYLDAHASGWRSAKHGAQWEATLATYAYPHFGNLDVADIGTGHVMDALRPIWHVKTETASRVRGRIEAILDYATPLEWRSGPNPARWKGHLAAMLPARAKVAAVEHHAALPWVEVAAFMAELRARDATAGQVLQFTILTAARSNEALGATWGEIDLASAVWTVPAARMKAAREHRVPLSPAALAVLRKAAETRIGQGGDVFVFPGAKANTSLSGMSRAMLLRRMGRGDLTVHGFRSTFRDWCSENTAFDRDTAEAALAHTVRDKVEAAYRRGDQLAKRRRLMDAWGGFCAQPPATRGEVTALRAAQ